MRLPATIFFCLEVFILFRYIGMERKSGIFEGRNYDNAILHFESDERTSSWVEGGICVTVKVKYAELPQIVQCDLVPGCLCDASFNRFGRLESLKIAK